MNGEKAHFTEQTRMAHECWRESNSKTRVAGQGGAEQERALLAPPGDCSASLASLEESQGTKLQ